MAITYPLALPTANVAAAISINMVNAVAQSESPFTFSQDVQKFDGERWEAEVTLPPMHREDARQWIAWLSSLKGQYGRFLMGDPDCETALGSAGGSPLVNGIGQTGENLTIDGAAASQTGWLKAGDYIQLGTGATATLHHALTDVDTNVSGQASFDIWPAMRSAPADNSAVVVSNTVGRWRLAANEQRFDIGRASQYGITFAAMEVVV